MYAAIGKRVMDFWLALLALVVLLPVLLLLVVLGAIYMKGNPFFTQVRPGKNGKLFRLVKFRSMTCEKDAEGRLLPDAQRLTAYGRMLRSTSLDELPELFNILKGDMSLVGPRPLLVEYLPLYSPEQMRRHEVRPGLTGYAQVHGRNAVSWGERFRLDVEYVERISLRLDLQILWKTVWTVLKREGIHSGTAQTMEPFMGDTE